MTVAYFCNYCETFRTVPEPNTATLSGRIGPVGVQKTEVIRLQMEQHEDIHACKECVCKFAYEMLRTRFEKVRDEVSRE